MQLGVSNPCCKARGGMLSVESVFCRRPKTANRKDNAVRFCDVRLHFGAAQTWETVFPNDLFWGREREFDVTSVCNKIVHGNMLRVKNMPKVMFVCDEASGRVVHSAGNGRGNSMLHIFATKQQRFFVLQVCCDVANFGRQTVQ